MGPSGDYCAYTKAAERVAAMQTGTVYGGSEAVGIKIDELFTRELKQ